MHADIRETGQWPQRVVSGRSNYFAVPASYRYLVRFVQRLTQLWLRTMRRRSQQDRTDWEVINPLASQYLPKPRICHPWPEQRCAVTTRGGSRMR